MARRLPPRGARGRFVRRGSRRRGGRRGSRGGLNLMKLLPVAVGGLALWYFFLRSPSVQALPGQVIDVEGRIVSPEEALISQAQPG
jgi:hypothetical protein